MTNSATYLKPTPICEWDVVRCGSKNGYQKDIMWLEEIGLCAQNLITILGSMVNISLGEGELYDHLMSRRIFTLIMNKIFI